MVSLSEGNARLMRSQAPRSVGPNDGGFDRFISPPDPGFVNPNGPPEQGDNTGPTGPLSVVTNMWLRADTVLQATAAGRVSMLVDKSNRGNHVPAPSATAQPTLVQEDATLGGMPAVYNNGFDQYMQLDSFFGGAPLWAWVIFKQFLGAGGTMLGAGVELQKGTTPGSMRLLNNSGLSPATSGTPVLTWARAAMRFGVSGIDTLQVRANTVTLASAGQRYGSAFTLWAAPGGASLIRCAIAEVLLTSGEPTSAEKDAIDAYGVARYGGGIIA